MPEEDAVQGTVIAIQIFGDFLGFNSHLRLRLSLFGITGSSQKSEKFKTGECNLQ